MEKNPAFQPLMIQLDTGELHSPRDLMRALAKASPDSSSFRAIADEIIQSMEANERFMFTKASIFQQLAVHGSSMDAAALANLLDLSRPLGLDAEQTANMRNLADNIAKQNGLGSVDDNLNFMNNAANPVPQPNPAEAAQTNAQQNPIFSQDADPSPIEFENERYNRKANNGASTTMDRSSSPNSSVHGPSSAESDFAGFMMVREAQAKSSGPAPHELTTLERSALSIDRKQESNESTLISGADKQSSLSDSAKPNEYMIDLQSKDPIERLKFFFANMLGIQPSNDLDDKGGSDTFPKGPPSCPPIRMQTATTVEIQKPQEKTNRSAVVLQPMEPLTFRLRQGRFVTASTFPQIQESMGEAVVQNSTKKAIQKEKPQQKNDPSRRTSTHAEVATKQEKGAVDIHKPGKAKVIAARHRKHEKLKPNVRKASNSLPISIEKKTERPSKSKEKALDPQSVATNRPGINLKSPRIFSANTKKMTASRQQTDLNRKESRKRQSQASRKSSLKAETTNMTGSISRKDPIGKKNVRRAKDERIRLRLVITDPKHKKKSNRK